MTKEEIERKALQRANEIIESWWFEMPWEYAEKEGMSEEDMEELLQVPFVIKLSEDA